VAVLKTGHLIR